MDYTQVFTAIMSAATAISVAALGVYQTKKTKETEAYKKLKDNLEKERAEKIAEKEEAEEARLQSIEELMKDMQCEISELKNDMKTLSEITLKNIEDQLSHMHTLQTDNFSYMRSLSGIVLTIGEGLNDSSAVDNASKDQIEKSIEDHKKMEIEIQKNLLNIIV